MDHQLFVIVAMVCTSVLGTCWVFTLGLEQALGEVPRIDSRTILHNWLLLPGKVGNQESTLGIIELMACHIV